jgi:hypothetical protein
VEANNTGGQGSRRAVAPSDDDDTVKQSRSQYCQHNIQKETNNITHHVSYFFHRAKWPER